MGVGREEEVAERAEVQSSCRLYILVWLCSLTDILFSIFNISLF